MCRSQSRRPRCSAATDGQRLHDALAAAGIGIGDVDVMDPTAASRSRCSSRRIPGLAADDPRGLYRHRWPAVLRGAGNNYAMHAIAEVASAPRAEPGSIGLVAANGGIISKHAAGVYSTTPTPWPVSADQNPPSTRLPGWSRSTSSPARRWLRLSPSRRTGARWWGILVCRADDGRWFYANADPADEEFAEIWRLVSRSGTRAPSARSRGAIPPRVAGTAAGGVARRRWQTGPVIRTLSYGAAALLLIGGLLPGVRPTVARACVSLRPSRWLLVTVSSRPGRTRRNPSAKRRPSLRNACPIAVSLIRRQRFTAIPSSLPRSRAALPTSRRRGRRCCCCARCCSPRRSRRDASGLDLELRQANVTTPPAEMARRAQQPGMHRRRSHGRQRQSHRVARGVRPGRPERHALGAAIINGNEVASAKASPSQQGGDGSSPWEFGERQGGMADGTPRRTLVSKWRTS